jgi:hypothetical protein
VGYPTRQGRVAGRTLCAGAGAGSRAGVGGAAVPVKGMGVGAEGRLRLANPTGGGSRSGGRCWPQDLCFLSEIVEKYLDKCSPLEYLINYGR